MSHAPDTGLAAYQVVLSMPLPADRLAWLLVALHRRVHRPLSPALAERLAARGPVLSWGALADVGEGRLADLQAVFGAPALSADLAALLAEMPPAEVVEASAAQWPRLPPPPPGHPLGEEAPFPPRIAEALGVAQATILGEPLALPALPFSSKIIHFREAVRRPVPHSAVVIGAGYIGAEVALGWAMAGAAVTLLERGDRLMPRFFDADVAVVQPLLVAGGVALLLETEALGWREQDGQVVVACRTDGRVHEIPADLVVVAVGVRR